MHMGGCGAGFFLKKITLGEKKRLSRLERDYLKKYNIMYMGVENKLECRFCELMRNGKL